MLLLILLVLDHVSPTFRQYSACVFCSVGLILALLATTAPGAEAVCLQCGMELGQSLGVTIYSDAYGDQGCQVGAGTQGYNGYGPQSAACDSLGYYHGASASAPPRTERYLLVMTKRYAICHYFKRKKVFPVYEVCRIDPSWFFIRVMPHAGFPAGYR